MKRPCIITVLCFLAIQANAQNSTAPIATGSNENGIQSFRSKGYETNSTQFIPTAVENEKADPFNPTQFISDAELKIAVHREKGNEQEAIALERRIIEIKKQYNLK